jgi:hypothetical protein
MYRNTSSNADVASLKYIAVIKTVDDKTKTLCEFKGLGNRALLMHHSLNGLPTDNKCGSLGAKVIDFFPPCVHKLKIANTLPAAKLDTNGKRLMREIRG